MAGGDGPRRGASGIALKAVLLFVAYALLVGWLTWPLPAHLTTHLPDVGVTRRYDNLVLAWALAHESRTLASDPRAFPDANAYHPARRALFYGEAGFGALPVFMPVFLASGNPALALNVVFLGGVALTGAAIHWVVRRRTGLASAGFVAAWAFLTTRWVLWRWLPSVPAYAMLVWLPFIIDLTADGPRGRDGPLLLALVALQCTVSFYLAVAIAPPLLAVGLCRTVRGDGATGLRILGVVAAASLVTLAVYSGSLLVRHGSPSFRTQSVWYDSARASMPVSELFWGFHSPLTVPLAVPALVLAGALLAGRAVGPLWRHCLVWVAIGLALSPTPTLTFHRRPIVLPHALLARWSPLYDLFRVPPRFGIPALIAGAMLAGMGFAALARRVRAVPTPVLTVLAALAMYVDYAHGSALAGLLEVPVTRRYPLMAAPRPDSPLLRILREDGGPLLELPVGGVRGPDSFFDAPYQADAVYRSIFHRRRILNGYNGYWPAGFPERMALARRLPDPAALAALRDGTGVELVLVHVKRFGMAERDGCRLAAHYVPGGRHCSAAVGAPYRKTWVALARAGGGPGLTLVARAGPDLLFRLGDSRQDVPANH